MVILKQKNNKIFLNQKDLEYVIHNYENGISIVESLKELCFVEEPYFQTIKEIDCYQWINQMFPKESKFIKLEFNKYKKSQRKKSKILGLFDI